MDYCVYQIGEHPCEFVIIFGDRIAPGLPDALLRTFGECDTSKLGQHDRLAPMRIAIQRQKPSTRPPAVKQLFGLDLGAIALTQVLDVCLIIMNTDNIGGAAFPAVISDYRAGGVQRLRQVI